MRVLKMRQRLHQLGYTLEQHGRGFMVSDGGVKRPKEFLFENLQQVEQWIASECQKANRLTEEDCVQWDEDWKQFVEDQKHGT